MEYKKTEYGMQSWVLYSIEFGVSKYDNYLEYRFIIFITSENLLNFVSNLFLNWSQIESSSMIYCIRNYCLLLIGL